MPPYISNSDSPASFWEHAEELRTTLIRSLCVILCGICISLLFYQDIFALLSAPLLRQENTELIRHRLQTERISNVGTETTQVVLPPDVVLTPRLSPKARLLSPNTVELPPGEYIDVEQKLQPQNLMIFGPIDGLTTALKISFWTGLVGTSPLWLLLLLMFVAPALRPREKRLLLPFLVLSLIFMTAGFLFAYFVTIPIGNKYFLAFNAEVGVNLWSLPKYMDYTIVLLLTNGLAFELGVVLLFLIHYGVVSAKTLVAKRRLMIVVAFILGALLTPPDVLTQVMMAALLILLYEMAILYARLQTLLAASD